MGEQPGPCWLHDSWASCWASDSWGMSPPPPPPPTPTPRGGVGNSAPLNGQQPPVFGVAVTDAGSVAILKPSRRR